VLIARRAPRARDAAHLVGRNASVANPAFRSALEKYLFLLEADILDGNIEELFSDQSAND
jgi:hypothetical protein